MNQECTDTETVISLSRFMNEKKKPRFKGVFLCNKSHQMADTSKLKKAAEIMFIEQGKNQKEIAQVLSISEQTISKWATVNKWKEERTARMNSVEKRADDIKKVIASLTERRLEITNEINAAKKRGDKTAVNDLQREAVGIGQEVAMYTKALQVMDKANKPTLSMYLEIMDDIFKSLNHHNSPLYLQTLDFQESHISNIAQKLG